MSMQPAPAVQQPGKGQDDETDTVVALFRRVYAAMRPRSRRAVRRFLEDCSSGEGGHLFGVAPSKHGDRAEMSYGSPGWAPIIGAQRAFQVGRDEVLAELRERPAAFANAR